MTTDRMPIEIEVPGRWQLKFRYSAGQAASRFLRALKEEGKLIATRCPQCERVVLPPQDFCSRCFIRLTDWVDLGTDATIESFTIVEEPFPDMPKPPFVTCFIRVGIASSTIPTYLSNVDASDLEAALERIQVDMPVKLIFRPKEEREGSFNDFIVVPAD